MTTVSYSNAYCEFCGERLVPKAHSSGYLGHSGKPAYTIELICPNRFLPISLHTREWVMLANYSGFAHEKAKFSAEDANDFIKTHKNG